MYIEAPYRNSNGTVSLTRTVRLVGGSLRTNTLAEALAALDVPNQSSPGVLLSRATRQFMQSGIAGGGRFHNTDYNAVYTNYGSTGAVRSVYREVSGSTRRYLPRAIPLGTAYTGFHDSGVGNNLNEVISGLPDSPNAVYNLAVMANMTNRVKTEARLRAARGSMDLAETFGGMPQTVRMIAELVTRVLKAFAAVRRGNIESALRNLGLNTRRLPNGKDAASTWMQLQYGWLPLLSDIFDGVALVQDSLNPIKAPSQFHIKVSHSEKLNISDVSGYVGWLDLEQKNSAEGSVTAGYSFVVEDAFWAYLSSLSLLNPVYLGWTLIPYSFVVDWMIPVGDVLSALTAPIGLKFVDGYITTRKWCEQSISASHRVAPTGTALVYEEGTATARAQAGWINRSAFKTLPGGMPYFRFPFSSDKRVASAIALISQRRG